MKPNQNSASIDHRYERKFLVSALDVHQARRLVRQHPGMFFEPYPPRFINNLYLDTRSLEFYADNVSGAMGRRKVRLRWYGDLYTGTQNSTLEIKQKTGMVGCKTQYPFPALPLKPNFRPREFKSLVRSADLPADVKQDLLTLDAVLFNRYHRRYFAARNNPFRITIDHKISYYKATSFGPSFPPAWRDHHHIIVEVKYPGEAESEAERVTSVFPFRMTRNSKYVVGVEKTYGYSAG